MQPYVYRYTHTPTHTHTHLLQLLHQLGVAQVTQAARATLVVAFPLWGGTPAALELLMKHTAVTGQMRPRKPLLSLE